VKYSARVTVLLKEGVGDPQGQTIEKALPALGFGGVHDVRVGKLIELTVEAPAPEQARAHVEDMCEKLLANPVIESYEVTIS
jgi:phosphoribosylformylglycinamidine synthase PurS subunit